MAKYTFYSIGMDRVPYFPAKMGDMSGPVAEWTTDITKAITWKDPECLDIIMNEYYEVYLVSIQEYQSAKQI